MIAQTRRQLLDSRASLGLGDSILRAFALMRLRVLATILLFSLGCSKAPPPAFVAASSNAEPASSEALSDAPSQPEEGRRAAVVFTGMCDASGAVPVSVDRFIVADDEDNILRTYDALRGGAPIASVDVSPELGLIRKGRRDKPGRRHKPDRPDKPRKSRETDIEGATRLGDLALFVTSHGRNSKGKLKPERLRFFATSLPDATTQMKVIGRAYDSLLEDMLGDPRLSAFGLGEAAELAPKESGALNIEGMTARKEGGVFIGFRNPIPHGKALIVPLLNPEQVILGQRAILGDPVLLDLGGRGVRSLSSWRGRYLIAAGDFSGEPRAALFTWDGAKELEPLPTASIAGFNPEGFFTPEDRDEIMILSDDGTELIEGEECKRLDDSGKKRFRGLWLKLPNWP